MTDLVSLLFVAMIPIDCKIQNFPYIAIKGRACLSDVWACHASVRDLTSGLLHTLGYCHKNFIDF